MLTRDVTQSASELPIVTVGRVAQSSGGAGGKISLTGPVSQRTGCRQLWLMEAGGGQGNPGRKNQRDFSFLLAHISLASP